MYTAPARFYAGGPVSTIRYYFAAPDAKPYPHWHVFEPLSMNLEVKSSDIGELVGPGIKRKKSKGERPAGMDGQEWHGNPEDYLCETAYPGPIPWSDVPACVSPPAIFLGGGSEFLVPATPVGAVLELGGGSLFVVPLNAGAIALGGGSIFAAAGPAFNAGAIALGGGSIMIELETEQVGVDVELAELHAVGDQVGVDVELAELHVAGDQVGVDVELAELHVAGDQVGVDVELAELHAVNDQVGVDVELAELHVAGEQVGVDVELAELHVAGEQVGADVSMEELHVAGEQIGVDVELAELHVAGEQIGVDVELAELHVAGDQVGVDVSMGQEPFVDVLCGCCEEPIAEVLYLHVGPTSGGTSHWAEAGTYPITYDPTDHRWKTTFQGPEGETAISWNCARPSQHYWSLNVWVDGVLYTGTGTSDGFLTIDSCSPFDSGGLSLVGQNFRITDSSAPIEP